MQYVVAIISPIAIGQLLSGPLAAQPVQASAFFLITALTARFFGFGPALACTATSAWIFWSVVVSTGGHPTNVQAARLGMFIAAAVVVSSVSRQRSNEARQAEKRYRSLVELSPDGIAVIDDRGYLIFANSGLARIFGARDVAQLATRELLDSRRVTELLGGNSVPPFEQTWTRLDGALVDVEVAAVPILRGGTFIGHLFVRNITDRKSAEQSVQQLSGRLLQVQDEERRQIAQELHDTTAQSLVAVQLNLSRISGSRAIVDAAMRQALEESEALIGQSITEIRTLSYLLHPAMIDEGGLIISLQWFIRGFQERSGIKTTLDAPDEIEGLPSKMETALFRIVQEALTNVQRHSGSSVATLRLRREPNCVRLDIEDQGRGLPLHLRGHDNALAASGLGIAGMRQRVRELGGRIEIRSEGHGTTVEIMIPVA